MSTATQTYTYTHVDIERVLRRFTADLVMIAQSTAAITEAKARQYAHDVEALAKEGYLKKVDLTLLSNGTEICATTFEVNAASGDLTMSRPGGVLWPRVANPYLRIVLYYTDSYNTAAREYMRNELEISWSPTDADTSHQTLNRLGGRNYTSNGWGMQRSDYQ